MPISPFHRVHFGMSSYVFNRIMLKSQDELNLYVSWPCL